jgi:hypothetical protein
MCQQVKDLVCITVSTKYDDILNITIHQNQKYFHRWFIITHPDDKATINVVKTANYSNVELVYFDFYSCWRCTDIMVCKDCKLYAKSENKDTYVRQVQFNKGGAIRYVQHMIRTSHPNKLVLILDSDIVLPDNFYDVISNLKVNTTTMYGVRERFDYVSYSDFIEDKNAYVYPDADKSLGFFQLYRQSYVKNYSQSDTCAECDTAFRIGFLKKISLPLTVKHLGKSSIHWNGRKSKNDFSME